MVDYLGTNTTGTDMKHGRKSQFQHRFKPTFSSHRGAYRMRGQCTRRSRQEPKINDGSTPIQYNPVKCASPQRCGLSAKC
ncbi:hypothetical protein PEX1_015790 [Penicillium expansum]|uniref:Uncharacterized protein n=1 Tax=Penicillium expansum TaxID=27334 RepID=A0A0A2KXC6_PENEN|nr:hypothetical protein PEX2_000390 [Penicillium expansum]KGO43410.1 hypothetical protein PEXP_097010 [Penicillium expansum]KGO57364.1 hypothetical protein PEX2_000390 [Penicillium expansum]KGO71551.1 hypothetical protein PEX1_015790 [Penicillium expansum]